MSRKEIYEGKLQIDYFSDSYLKFEEDFYRYSALGEPLTTLTDDILRAMAMSPKNYFKLSKRRFKCKDCGKMAIAETPLVKKNHQISVAVNQKIAQLLIENQAMKHIAHRLSISTSSVMKKLNEFKFETDWNTLPEVMSWDEYAFKKGKMSFIAQDFDSLNVIAILDGRTQATIRNHFLRYPRKVRNRVKVITMDMFSPYYQLVKQLFPNAKIVLDRFHIVQHLSCAMNRVRIQILTSSNRK